MAGQNPSIDKPPVGASASIRNLILERHAAQQSPFRIVGVLAAPIPDRPGLRNVIGNRSGIRPHMPVPGNISAVVKIVKNPELASQPVLIGGDLLAVHYQRGVAICARQIAENLIIRPVFLNNVNHVMDFVFTAGERHAVAVAAQRVGFRNLFCVRQAN